MFAGGCGAGRAGADIKGHEEASGGDRSGHRKDCGDGSMGMNISQNILNCTC